MLHHPQQPTGSTVTTSGATAPSGSFPLTHWSAVVAAGHSGSSHADQALAELCRVYWYPLYAFARRMGQAPADAQDLTQAFFTHLIESRLVAKADARRGRFRTFLLGAFKRFMATERKRAGAQKRGSGQLLVSLDVADAEARFGEVPAAELSPEAVFDRSWAMAVFGEAFARMEAEFSRAGRAQQFEQLCPCLEGEDGAPDYLEAARNLGMTAGTIKVTVSRMRRRYRHLLRAVMLETVDEPREVEEELRHLRVALQG